MLVKVPSTSSNPSINPTLLQLSYSHVTLTSNKPSVPLPNSTDVKRFLNLLSLISAILDKSLDQIKPPTDQFIFSKNNIDKWVLFKNLSSQELQLSFMIISNSF